MKRDERFSEQDHETWRQLYSKQTPLRYQQVIPEFSRGLEVLGITGDFIPDLSMVNERLMAITGWRGEYVSGFVEPAQFFQMLSQRKFPVGGFIRDPKDLSYTPEPDVFHDLYGHLPFFTIPEYAAFCRNFGDRAYKYARSKLITDQFQRLFWFTIEFGLINTPDGRRIFGAGIASSFSECAYALSDKPHVHKFDMEKIRNKDFRIDLIQEDLYLLGSADQLYKCLDDFEMTISAG